MKKTLIYIFFALLLGVSACSTGNNPTSVISETASLSNESAEVGLQPNEKNEEQGEKKMKVTGEMPLKSVLNNNPVYTQEYSADPYAMEYNGRLYLYMTGDETMYNADGSIKTNDYSNINTIRVISSDDLVNWTDHGEVYAAGKSGAATWGNNSWAPAACWKEINGKPKFFLYFANSGNGIAVLTSDSPTGPFTDPIGGPLISRSTPNCASVSWLFDPAVLIDDDGTGYLYVGGGIPNPDMVSNPGTARVVKLNDDMISLACDPVTIENVAYLFEDSGINKINGKYVYSYCSNFNVPAGGAEGYGFESGEIITMISDDPMGPFTYVRGVLKNPGYFFSYGGNNHHCIFTFKDKWYITYHASLIEEAMGASHGYRSVNIDEASVNEDGTVNVIKGTKEGVSQVKYFNPYEEQLFTTMANQSGIEKVAADATTEKYGSGNYNLKVAKDGCWIQVTGVDFAEGATKLKVVLQGATEGSISVRTKYLNGSDAGKLNFKGTDEFAEYELIFETPLTGVNTLYFLFEGVGVELKSYHFE